MYVNVYYQTADDGYEHFLSLYTHSRECRNSFANDSAHSLKVDVFPKWLPMLSKSRTPQLVQSTMYIVLLLIVDVLGNSRFNVAALMFRSGKFPINVYCCRMLPNAAECFLLPNVSCKSFLANQPNKRHYFTMLLAADVDLFLLILTFVSTLVFFRSYKMAADADTNVADAI